MIPLPDHDPANAENGPGSARAAPALKSSNAATAAAPNEYNVWICVWICNAIRSAPCPQMRPSRGRV